MFAYGLTDTDIIIVWLNFLISAHLSLNQIGLQIGGKNLVYIPALFIQMSLTLPGCFYSLIEIFQTLCII